MIPMATSGTPLLAAQRKNAPQRRWMPTWASFVIASLLIVCGIVWITQEKSIHDSLVDRRKIRSHAMGESWIASIDLGDGNPYEDVQAKQTPLIELDGKIVAMGVTKNVELNPDEWYFFKLDGDTGNLENSRKIVTPTLYSFDSILGQPTRLLPDRARQDFIINGFQEDPTQRVIYARMSKDLELKWSRSLPSHIPIATRPSSLSLKKNRGLLVAYGWEDEGHVEIVKFNTNNPSRGIGSVDYAYQLVYQNEVEGTQLILEELDPRHFRRGGGGDVIGAVSGYPDMGMDMATLNDLLLFRIDDDGTLAWAWYYRGVGVQVNEWARGVQVIDEGKRIFVTGQSDRERFHLTVMAETGHILSGFGYGRSVLMDDQQKMPHGNDILAYDEESNHAYIYSTYSSTIDGQSVYGFLSKIDVHTGELLDSVAIGGTAIFAELIPIVLSSSDFEMGMIDIAFGYRVESRYIRVIKLTDVFNYDNAEVLCAFDSEVTLQKACFDDLRELDFERQNAMGEFTNNLAQIDVLGYPSDIEDLIYDSFSLAGDCPAKDVNKVREDNIERDVEAFRFSWLAMMNGPPEDAPEPLVRNNGLCGMSKRDLPDCSMAFCEDDPDARPIDVCSAQGLSVNPQDCGGRFQQVQCRDCGDNAKCVRLCDKHVADSGAVIDCAAECGALALDYKCFHGC